MPSWTWLSFPDSKVHGANMGPIWGRQYPGGPNVGPMNFAIWAIGVVNGLSPAQSIKSISGYLWFNIFDISITIPCAGTYIYISIYPNSKMAITMPADSQVSVRHHIFIDVSHIAYNFDSLLFPWWHHSEWSAISRDLTSSVDNTPFTQSSTVWKPFWFRTSISYIQCCAVITR